MKKFLLLLLALACLQLNAQTDHPEAFKSIRSNNLKSGIQIYYNPVLDKYDLHFLKLDIEVSDKSTYVSGNALLEAKAVKPLDTLLFDFSNYMTVDSVLLMIKKLILAIQTTPFVIYLILPLPLTKILKHKYITTEPLMHMAVVLPILTIQIGGKM